MCELYIFKPINALYVNGQGIANFQFISLAYHIYQFNNGKLYVMFHIKAKQK